MVKKTAKDRIRSKFNDCRWCLQKPIEQPSFELDWSEVHVIPEKSKFETIELNEEVQNPIRVISSTTFTNASKVSQWHKIKTERQIISSYEISISEGCIIGNEIEISLPAPDELRFLTDVLLIRKQHDFHNESSALVGTECIKIPKGDTMTVTIQSKKQQTKFNFTASIGIKGTVNALFDNPDTNKGDILKISLRDIFQNEMPKLDTEEKNDTIFFTIKGSCKCKNDREQEIIIKHVNST